MPEPSARAARVDGTQVNWIGSKSEAASYYEQSGSATAPTCLLPHRVPLIDCDKTDPIPKALCVIGTRVAIRSKRWCKTVEAIRRSSLDDQRREHRSFMTISMTFSRLIRERKKIQEGRTIPTRFSMQTRGSHYTEPLRGKIDSSRLFFTTRKLIIQAP